jgi:hypothetical protein
MNKLEELKNRGSDRSKILLWLASINAPQDEIDELLELCKNDIECRKFYVKLYDETLA